MHTDETSAPGDDRTPTFAEQLFAEFVARVESGEAADIEAWAQRHPGEAEALRRLHARWRRVQRALALPDPTAPGPTVRSALGRRYGASVSVDVELVHEGVPPVPAFLRDRLATQGPDVPRYELRDEVARGGMGVVLEVWDRDLRRRLAMKVLRRDAGEPDERRIARFLDEAQVTSQLDHPGIVPVHDLGVDSSGRVYFTMPLVRGRNLREVIALARAGEEGWNRRRAVGVLLRVGQAVAFAHEKGVVHRDLKPANIMVGRFGETYVLDWGLARVLGHEDHRDLRLTDVVHGTVSVRTGRRDERERSPDSPLLTMDGDVVGTPSYMSPEQARGEVERIDRRSDVYALGTLLYHLLTGELPYVPRDTPMSPRTVLAALLHGPPPPILTLDPEAPAELVAICDKAMARDPTDRYATASELSDDLDNWLHGRPVTAREPTRGYLLRLALRRHRAVVTTAAAALVLLLLWGTVYLVQVTRARDAVQFRSDIAHAQLLRGEVAELWPAVPRLVPVMERWLGRADDLLSRHPARGEAPVARAAGGSASSGGGGRPDEDDPPAAAGRADPSRTGRSAAGLATGPPAGGEALPPSATAEEIEQAAFEADLAWLREAREGVVARIARAGTLWDETVETHRTGWEAATAALATNPHYEGVELPPQLGLVPLGPDPDSGLLEFAMALTGEVPPRGDDGRLVLDEASAVVLVLVPGRTFVMGSPPDQPRRQWDEERREVRLDPYLLGKHEVTQAQYVRLMGVNPSLFRAGIELTADDRGPAEHDLIGWTNPVESVNWFDADACARRMDGRLPTEAEWEFACGAGRDAPYVWGGDWRDLEGRENVMDRTYLDRETVAPWWDGAEMHAPVGSYPATPWGLHDMLGNVMEWCADWYVTGLEPDVGERRKVVRGGGWGVHPASVRVAARFKDAPRGLNQFRGFRVARDVRFGGEP